MKLLLIIAVAGFLYGWITYKPPEKKKAPAAPAAISVTMYDVKKAEQERKQAARKAQARRDIETAQATINDLDVLMDAAQERYHDAAGSKETEKALRQIMTLRKQIATTENRLEKAKYIVKYE